MPILKSRHQAEILASLFLRPGEEYTLSDLARHLGVSPGTVHAEIERLVQSGLIRDRMVGRSRLLQANTDARTSRALTELLTLTFGPEVVVAEEFDDVAGAEMVVIYGSWARRYHGEVGREAADVDVMVVGKVDWGEVYEAAERAEARLNVSVNPTVRSISAWSDESDPSVVTAKPGALVVIDRSRGEAT